LNHEFWRSVNEVPTRQVRLDEHTFIMAWGREVCSCLARGLIEAVICLPIYNLVIEGRPQNMVVEPSTNQLSRPAGSQEPESGPDFGPRRERQCVA
jgi:hypothetical protein